MSKGNDSTLEEEEKTMKPEDDDNPSLTDEENEAGSLPTQEKSLLVTLSTTFKEKQSTASLRKLDLSRPDAIQVGPAPSQQQRTIIYCADSCKSFLFVQAKHQSNWVRSMGFFLATSRSVERIFAKTKDLLERNWATRTDLLEALVSLSDLKPSLLADIWNRYHHLGVKDLAKSALKEAAKGREIDAIYLANLLEAAKSHHLKFSERLKTDEIKQRLIPLQILPEKAKKYFKRHLEQALTEDEIKEMKRQKRFKVGDLETKLLEKYPPQLPMISE